MLSIAAMGSGQAKYYTNLATEDYYLAGGEPPGKWLGSGARALGLTGTVDELDLHNLLGGYSADGRDPLVQNADAENRQEGWDLTFSAPKSVSVLWANADDITRREIQEAHVRAVKEALSYLEEVAGICRVGKGGRDSVKARLLFAVFEHGTSRAQDPQLHTHCLMINLGIGEDGKTRAIKSLPIYVEKMTAGAVYRVALAYNLENSLGLVAERKETWFELKGVSEAALDEFSTRRRQIEEKLQSLGIESAIAAAYAALETRGVKEHLPRDLLFNQRQEISEAHGVTWDSLQLLLHQTPDREPQREFQAAFSEALVQATANQSHFSEGELLRGVLQASQGRGIDVEPIRRAVEHEIDNCPELLRLRDIDGQACYTTRQMWQTEELLLNAIERSRNMNAHQVDAEAVERAIAQRPTIKDEQSEALRHITQTPGSIKVVSGMAGTGKTFMLSAAREVWQGEGYQVLGSCLAGTAALELQAGSGIESDTLAARFLQLEQGWLSRKTIFVLDEAGMVGTRDMARILNLIEESGTKLIVVGDERQLPAIEAGGAFEAMGRTLGKAELKEVVRQKDERDQERVHALAQGASERALEILAERGTLVVADDPSGALERLIADWSAQGAGEPGENLILVNTNQQARQINRRCQQSRELLGTLDASKRIRVGREYVYLGDRVLFTEKARRYGLENGDFGTVENVDSRYGLVKVRLDRRRESPGGTLKTITVTVPLEEYDSLRPGYAVTTHKIQGGTLRNVFVLASGSPTDRELAYVQGSRAIYQTRVYADAMTGGQDLEALQRAMSRSRAKQLAHTSGCITGAMIRDGFRKNAILLLLNTHEIPEQGDQTMITALAKPALFVGVPALFTALLWAVLHTLAVDGWVLHVALAATWLGTFGSVSAAWEIYDADFRLGKTMVTPATFALAAMGRYLSVPAAMAVAYVTAREYDMLFPGWPALAAGIVVGFLVHTLSSRQ